MSSTQKPHKFPHSAPVVFFHLMLSQSSLSYIMFTAYMSTVKPPAAAVYVDVSSVKALDKCTPVPTISP